MTPQGLIGSFRMKENMTLLIALAKFTRLYTPILGGTPRFSWYKQLFRLVRVSDCPISWAFTLTFLVCCSRVNAVMTLGGAPYGHH